MSSKLYDSAAHIIEEASLKKKTVKGLCFASKFKRKKILYALVVESLKKKALLLKLISRCENILKNKPIEESLLIVLLYETLFGKGLPRDHAHYELFDTNKSTFLDTFNDLAQQFPDLCKSLANSVCLPRYVRVNTLKTSIEDVIDVLTKDGYTLVKDKPFKNLEKNEVTIDKDIPNVLVFYPNIDFHSHNLYKKGHIILQDKASCLPAYILDPPKNSVIVDACAAPGNKSTHLASIINNQGTIYSFDLDKTRLELLKRMVKVADASCVQPFHQDFLKVKGKHPAYNQAQYILLDPSCSGSGIVSRLDHCIDNQNETSIERLESLSGFQTLVLCHALSFPNVKRVVYSTCSIHQQENEDVVQRAYERFNDQFQLIPILPEWKNRGTGEWELADRCLRAVTDTELTNGFFVAMFQKRESTDANGHNHSNNTQSSKRKSSSITDNFKEKSDSLKNKPSSKNKRQKTKQRSRDDNENLAENLSENSKKLLNSRNLDKQDKKTVSKTSKEATNSKNAAQKRTGVVDFSAPVKKRKKSIKKPITE